MSESFEIESVDDSRREHVIVLEVVCGIRIPLGVQQASTGQYQLTLLPLPDGDHHNVLVPVDLQVLDLVLDLAGHAPGQLLALFGVILGTAETSLENFAKYAESVVRAELDHRFHAIRVFKLDLLTS